MLMNKKLASLSLVALGAMASCESDDPGGVDEPRAGSAGSGGTSNQAGSSAAGDGNDRGGAGGASPGAAGRGGDDAVGGEAGVAGSGGEGSGPPLPSAMFAYVSTVLGQLLLCSVNPESGETTLLPSSPLQVDGHLHGLAADAAGKHLFLLTDPPRIDTFAIANDGSLSEEPSSSVELDDDEPLLAMALDPAGRFVYVSSPFNQTLHTLALDAESGELEVVGQPMLVGPDNRRRSPAFVAVHPSGHYVYVTQMVEPLAAEEDNGIRGYRINQDTGALTELPGSPFGDGSMVAGALAFRPDGEFLFSSGGGLNAFTVDEASGDLALITGSPFTEDVGSDPWAPNLAISPQGGFVYVSHFLPTQHVSGFAIDAESGELEAVPGSPITTSAPYSIAIDPTGRFLFVGDDSGHVPVYSSSRANGSLTPVAGSPFDFGGLEPDFAFVTRP